MQLELVEEYPLKRKVEFGRRVYATPNGKKYPSVTTVLGQMNKKSIDEWRKRVGEKEANRISNESSSVGTKMHQLCEDYMLGRELDSSNEKQFALFESIKPKIDQLGDIYGIELPLYSDYLKLAGTADLVAEYDGNLCILDFKNSRKPKIEDWVEGYYLQGTCYARMFWERYGVLPKEVVVWIAVWDGTFQEFRIKVKDKYPKLINVLKTWHPDW